MRSPSLPLLEPVGPACCPTGLSSPIDADTAAELAQLLRTVADPARLQLLAFIRSSPGGEACVCDLTEVVGLSQPTVSHHLKVLSDAGLLVRSKRGRWAWYSIVPERLREIGAVLA